jgi:hypothetical protein
MSFIAHWCDQLLTKLQVHIFPTYNDMPAPEPALRLPPVTETPAQFLTRHTEKARREEQCRLAARVRRREQRRREARIQAESRARPPIGELWGLPFWDEPLDTLETESLPGAEAMNWVSRHEYHARDK